MIECFKQLYTSPTTDFLGFHALYTTSASSMISMSSLCKAEITHLDFGQGLALLSNELSRRRNISTSKRKFQLRKGKLDRRAFFF